MCICVRSSDDEAETFGWDVYHDQQRNLVYYLHNYTGEVRWIHPSKTGFVMDGFKPLPVDQGDAIAQWSPYYPHVVMLPSGLMHVHPALNPDYSVPLCGYNRFPLPRHVDAKDVQQFGLPPPEYRILPPTWEQSQHGSPFLPPYPVAILGTASTYLEALAAMETMNEPNVLYTEARNAIEDRPKAIKHDEQHSETPALSSADYNESFNAASSNRQSDGKHCTASPVLNGVYLTTGECSSACAIDRVPRSLQRNNEERAQPKRLLLSPEPQNDARAGLAPAKPRNCIKTPALQSCPDPDAVLRCLFSR